MAAIQIRLAFVALVLSPTAGCMPLEQSFIFHPIPFPQGDWKFAEMPHEDAAFRTEDGSRLHGWFAAVPNPRAVVLYCHGNAGNVASYDWVLPFFAKRLQCSVLVFDYRGYGKSEGTPSGPGILADARAARRWLAEKTGVAENDIVVVGHSLGGAVAVDLAAKDGARGLVLESTFSSFGDVAQYHAAPLPVRWLLTTHLDSASLISKYHGPLLQLHGDADQLIPIEEGRSLFMAANEPKVFVTAPGGGHNDPPPMEYVKKLDEFLGSLPAPGFTR